MGSPIIRPETVSDAWSLYTQYLQENNKQDVIPLAQTALFRYTLPGYGLEYGSNTEAALEFIKGIPLRQFVDALNIQQNVFDYLDLKKGTQRPCRYRLRQMLTWCSSQDWWKLSTSADSGQFAPRRRNKLGNAHHATLTNRKVTSHYNYSLHNFYPDKFNPKKFPTISAEEVKRVQIALERIQVELQQLRRFLTGIQVRYRQDRPVRADTADKIEKFVYLILGWLYFFEKDDPDDLELKRLDDIDIAYDFTEWQREERNLSPKTEVQALIALLNIAKFLHCKESDAKHCGLLRKSYVDIEIVGELRKLIRDANERAQKAPITTSDESKKWLNWPEYLACVEYLKKDCAPLTSDNQQRTNRAIARSYERYLIAALLAYMPPDRQRTFRELEEGRTLVRGDYRNGIFYPGEDGDFYIKLSPDDYKTGETYGEQILKIPEPLVPYLKNWLTKWRLTLDPNHNFVFTQLNGKPHTKESIYQLFRHAIYRASVVLFGEGRATNPHLVRDMIVTHLYEIEASEAVMDALAVGMKHSRKTQRKSYDRRTKQAQVDPALKMMKELKPSEIPKPKLKIVEPEPVTHSRLS